LSLQREHDILLSPYISATQSATTSDSLAFAAPVVATPVGALAEQVGAGGWIAESATGGAFGAALSRALDERVYYPEKSTAALVQAQRAWTQSWDWLERL
jgi:glycosyltransferase involved in cell wall biosynthesis